AFLWDNTLRRHAFLVIGLLVPSIVAVSAGFYFRPHYFIVALPVVAILIGISVIAMLHLIEEMRTVSWMRVVPLAVFAAAWLTGIFVNADVYFKLNPFQVSRALYRANPFNESLSVAEYVKQHTSPNDKIMVFGSEPQIYF